MPITTFFFDLDDTLYPPSTGLWDALKRRMERYLHERLDIPVDEIAPLREKLYTTYGTTLRGLQMTRGIDTQEYLAFVHDVPLTEFIQPDPRVRSMLENLPGRKLIFTNSDCNHANRVLSILGLENVFADIIDINAIAPYCKPQPEAFQIALRRAGNPDPRACVMLDDAPRNLVTAHTLGMGIVCVGAQTLPEGIPGVSIPHVTELLTILPAIRTDGSD